MAIARRIGAQGLAALVGVVLILVGLAVMAVEAQLRSDAATVSVTLNDEDLELLEQSQFGWDAAEMRHWLIVENLLSNGPMPTLVVQSDDSGQAWVNWGTGNETRVSSAGGWQLKPTAILPAAGVALLVGTLFAAAARWRPRHPLPSN